MTLHAPQPQDLDDLCTMERDAQTMATLLGVRGREETAAGLDRMMEHWRRHGFGWWIARDAGTGAFLGRGGLRRVRVADRDEVEVGYSFHADFWGRGLATELSREGLAFGFTELVLDSVIAFTLPQNAASRRVMEKCRLKFEHEGLWAGYPHVFYRINRNEWLNSNLAPA
jgi:ribosomal-protein-alanine N-acetyltransferase